MRPKNWPFSQFPGDTFAGLRPILWDADTSPSQVLEFWAYRCLISLQPLLPVFVFSFLIPWANLHPASRLRKSTFQFLPGGLLQIFGAQIISSSAQSLSAHSAYPWSSHTCSPSGLPLGQVCALSEAQEGSPLLSTRAQDAPENEAGLDPQLAAHSMSSLKQQFCPKPSSSCSQAKLHP